MGIIADILKEVPLSSVLRERLTELEKRHEQLKEENVALLKENQQLKEKLAALTKTGDVEAIEQKILLLLAEHDGVSAPQVTQMVQVAAAKAEYYLERMCEQDLINAARFVNRGADYYIGQKGREFLVKNDLI